jgi:hypothetical protein
MFSWRQADRRQRTSARIQDHRSSKNLPHNNRDQARKRERYQIDRHRFSNKTTVRQIARRRAIVSARTLSPLRGPRQRKQSSRRGPARSRVHGQSMWFGRRRACRRSMNAFQRGRGRDARDAVRFLQSKRKSPQRMLPARASQTRFDDGILPVFCPTCQTKNSATSDGRQVRGETLVKIRTSARSPFVGSSTLPTSCTFRVSDSGANASCNHRGQPVDACFSFARGMVVGPAGTARILSFIVIPPHMSRCDWRPATDCPDTR